jgi:hypothetical protein
VNHQAAADYARCFGAEDLERNRRAGTASPAKADDSARLIVVAKFRSRCGECGKPIAAGDEIAWRRLLAPLHLECWRGAVRP